jgi:hypothetical protein
MPQALPRIDGAPSPSEPTEDRIKRALGARHRDGRCRGRWRGVVVTVQPFLAIRPAEQTAAHRGRMRWRRRCGDRRRGWRRWRRRWWWGHWRRRRPYRRGRDRRWGNGLLILRPPRHTAAFGTQRKRRRWRVWRSRTRHWRDCGDRWRNDRRRNRRRGFRRWRYFGRSNDDILGGVALIGKLVRRILFLKLRISGRWNGNLGSIRPQLRNHRIGDFPRAGKLAVAKLRSLQPRK